MPLPQLILLRQAFELAKLGRDIHAQIKALPAEDRKVVVEDTKRLSALLIELRGHGIDRWQERRGKSSRTTVPPDGRPLDEVVAELDRVVSRLTAVLAGRVSEAAGGGGVSVKRRALRLGVKAAAHKVGQVAAARGVGSGELDHPQVADRLTSCARGLYEQTGLPACDDDVSVLAEAAAELVVTTRLQPFAAEQTLTEFVDAVADWTALPDPKLGRIDALSGAFVEATAQQRAERRLESVAECRQQALVILDNLDRMDGRPTVRLWCEGRHPRMRCAG